MIRGVGAIKSPSGVQFPRGTSPGECMGGEAFRHFEHWQFFLSDRKCRFKFHAVGYYRVTACNMQRNARYCQMPRTFCPYVCLSVCLSACFVTKRKQLVPTFLYHMKDYYFLTRNGWWGQPFLPEILGQTDPVEAKTPVFNRYSLVVKPQP